MQVTKEQKDPCAVLLSIEVDAETVDNGFKRAYRDFSKITNVPGFRPGTAPRPVLERYVNHERLLERVQEIVAVPAYRKALEQESVQPYADPEVEFEPLEEGKPWSFKATIPTPPIVELGDLTSISVEKPIYSVSDEDIEGQLDEVRGEHARLVNAPDRPVRNGDAVIAEMSVTPEGEETEEPKRTLIRVGNNIPGFDEQIIGLNQGEEKTFALTYPEDFQESHLAGRKASFALKVQSVNERVLPDLVDEWVKETLQFDSVESLKADIRTKMEAQAEEVSARVAESRVLDQLIRKSKLTYPSVMVEEEVRGDLHELAHELEKRDMSYEGFLMANKFTKEQHHEQLAKEAEPRVEGFLILRELAKQEQVVVSPGEIDAETANVDLSRYTHDQIERIRLRVADRILKRKLRSLLLTKAKVTEVAPKPAEE